MTAQISDTIEHLTENFDITGTSGVGLFDPKDHGLTPVFMSTACYRGFSCRYSVDRGILFLDSLCIGLGRDERLRTRYNRNPPQLFGVTPRAPNYDEDKIPKDGNTIFEDLQHRVNYTGGLLIATDFIRELYVHMGFHPAWKYRIVHELIFNDGELVESHDRSAAIAEFRDDMKDAPLKPDVDSTRQEIRQWIERCFSQDYRW
jgi:hypothetical protein